MIIENCAVRKPLPRACAHGMAQDAGSGDPFRITGPAVISFSGGRTSAYMLWRVLQAHGGTLPDDVLVCFANTGLEMPATLRFVHDCAEHWGVRVLWLEYRHDPATDRQWAEAVGPNSASRNGEPMDAVIARFGVLPNAVARFCTQELKIRTLFRWLDVEGWPRNTRRVIGFRADEPHRVERARDPVNRKKRGREGSHQIFPLFDAGVAKAEVLSFWKAQPFDLGLAGAWEGNCAGCFLKRRSALARMFLDHPAPMAWWPAKEQAMAAQIGPGGGALFRDGDPKGYAGIRDLEFSQARLDLDPEDDGADVFAACDVGCGA